MTDTADRTEKIRKLTAMGVSLADIAKRFGLDEKTVTKIRIEHGFSPQPSKGWTDNEIATLKRMFAEEASAFEIAMQLPGRSRNAVIGACHRMGLFRPTLPKPKVRRVPPPKKALARAKRSEPKPAAQNPHHGRQGHVVGDEATIQKVRAKKAGEGRTLVERVENGCGVLSPNARPFLQASGCKWPIERDGQTLYCCNPVQGQGRGRIWCAGHLSAGVMRQPSEFSDKAIQTMVKHDGVEPMADAA